MKMTILKKLYKKVSTTHHLNVSFFVFNGRIFFASQSVKLKIVSKDSLKLV
jgi:hypothetical protein